MLLDIPQHQALREIAIRLNHPSERVSRRFFGVALWMHHKPMVGAILRELESNGARNMQIYALLGHLTQRPLRHKDLGLEWPSPKVYAKKRAEYLAKWHPKFLANWKAWWAEHSKEDPDQWWIAGLKRAGYDISSTQSLASVPTLIETLTDESFDVRLVGLNLLQRLTFRDLHRVQYLELTDYDLGRAMRNKYPDPNKRPKVGEKEMLKLAQADWREWFKKRADRKPYELAREECDRALKLLKKLSRKRGNFTPREIEAAYSAVYFLRRLTDQGVPYLPWGNDPGSQMTRTKLLPFFPRLIQKKLDDPVRQRELASGWWF